jgi:hypothetical protein
MLLKYGGYSFQLHGAGLTVDKQAELNEANEPVRTVSRINVMMRLLNTASSPTRATMDALVRAFESAHLRSGHDLVLYQPDGTTETAHAWRSANCIGGVRIVGGPSYPEYQGAEGINYRTVQVQFEAITALADARSALRSFTETITISGGGPVFGHLVPKQGRPIKQLLSEASVCRATQRGAAVGLYQYPFPPGPIWPEALVNPPGEISYSSARRIGTDSTDFAASWSYEYEHGERLFGGPNQWPNT